jgi:tryptophan-rich sensory protein
VRRSLRWYAVQLVLNVAWSALFFGARRPGWALGEILLLWGAVGAWLSSASRVDARAAGLVAPYLA